MDLAPHQPFSYFPNEIVELIFVTAAYHDPRIGLRLSVLSQAWRSIILSVLLDTVILRSIKQTHSFITLLSLRPELSNCVRNLWITYFDPGDICAPIFSQCENVRSAALQHTFLRFRLNPFHSLHEFACKELSIVGPSFSNDWEDDVQNLLLFSSITHLRLFDTLSVPETSGRYISQLPQLTHLALPFHEHIDTMNPFLHMETLLHSASLTHIIISINYRMITPLSARTNLDAWAISAREWDDRLYVVFVDTRNPDMQEWVSACRGEESIWERAEREREERDERIRYLISIGSYRA